MVVISRRARPKSPPSSLFRFVFFAVLLLFVAVIGAFVIWAYQHKPAGAQPATKKIITESYYKKLPS